MWGWWCWLAGAGEMKTRQRRPALNMHGARDRDSCALSLDMCHLSRLLSANE